MAKTEKLRGKEGFDKFYENLFAGRWADLKKSFFSEVCYAQWTCENQKPYFLDTGSVLAALNLPLKGGKNILDLCAAPGGKTLILASLMDEDAILTSNDRSPNRKQRLVKVCDESLPPSVRERVTVSCSDGAKWCTRQTECFDRILLDAPCSSERHVALDSKYLDEWTPSRIKSLSMEQWALLSSAYRMLVPGGYLLYSTCALSPAENDEVVSRLFKKFDDVNAVFEQMTELPALLQETADKISGFTGGMLPAQLPGAEKTKYGFHVLPDKQNGAGPLYFALIQKKL